MPVPRKANPNLTPRKKAAPHATTSRVTPQTAQASQSTRDRAQHVTPRLTVTYDPPDTTELVNAITVARARAHELEIARHQYELHHGVYMEASAASQLAHNEVEHELKRLYEREVHGRDIPPLGELRVERITSDLQSAEREW